MWKLSLLAFVSVCGFFLTPAIGSSQMMRPPGPNVTGIYAGANYYPYRTGGYGPGYYFGRPFSATPAPSYYYTPPVFVDPATIVSPASIDIRVPANAEIWFDGDKTSQKGSSRTFESPPLQPGRRFTYEVRARWLGADGKVFDETRRVRVQAGRHSKVDFVSATDFAPH